MTIIEQKETVAQRRLLCFCAPVLFYHGEKENVGFIYSQVN